MFLIILIFSAFIICGLLTLQQPAYVQDTTGVDFTFTSVDSTHNKILEKFREAFNNVVAKDSIKQQQETSQDPNLILTGLVFKARLQPKYSYTEMLSKPTLTMATCFPDKLDGAAAGTINDRQRNFITGFIFNFN